MSTATESPKRASDLPQPILFPLEVGMPCLFWSRGERLGDPRPAIMIQRSGLDFVTLAGIRPGMTSLHANVRHVDDPYLQSHPLARRATGAESSNGGAWDYVPDMRYEFFVPARAVTIDGVELEFAQLILHLANLGWSPDLMAGTIRRKGLSKDLIEQVLAANRR
jgi:hypothetical protein